MAYGRVLIGMLKVALVGAFFMHVSDRFSQTQLHANKPTDVLKFAAIFYCYPAYIYFNFAGYCDIVIAGAALCGMVLPENFNHPWLARNPIDFWTRWHMTLTHLIRDYLFTPLYKNIVQRRPALARQASYGCYFVAPFLAGVWHGSSWNFVVFGLLHGMGVSVAKMWEESIIRRRKRAGLREYLKSPKIRVAAVVATFHFICFTFLFFPPDLRWKINFLRRFIWDH